MESVKLTRKELYDLVWAEPMVAVAKKFNISDSGLRKICKRMNIPIPLTGHWSKLKFGKPVIVLKFPIEFEGEDEIIINAANTDTAIKILVEKEKLIQNTDIVFKVPSKLNKPHKYIIELQNYLNEHHQYDKDKSYSLKIIKVSSSRTFINRVLCFLDAFIKILEEKMQTITIRHDICMFTINKVDYEVSIREKQKRIIDPNSRWNSTILIPTGKLVFQFSGFCSSSIKEWEDGKKTLEEQFLQILSFIEYNSKKDYEDKLESQRNRKIYEEKQQQKIEQKKKVEQELTLFNELVLNANRYNQTQIIRNYIAHKEFDYLNKKEPNEVLDNWINWAKEKADWYDPFIEKDVQLLDKVDRNTLKLEQERKW